jgi:peptide/nickel transport system substrate-binding protein
MKKYRWQLLILFLTGIVVGTLLILEKRGGLGVSEQPRPAEGGAYTEALVGSIQRLNPLLDSKNSVDRDVDKLIYSGIVKFGSDGIPEPDLAESVGASQDGKLYNIVLKKDLVWHDGEPLTSADILFTIELMRNGGDYITKDVQELWKAVEVKVFDDQNLQLVLPEAYAPFMDYLSFGVLPKHIFGDMTLDQIASSSINLEPVGSGPFQFSELSMEGSSIVGITLTAFKDYAGTKPFLQKIVFRYYPDPQSAYKAYQDGYVQGISELSNDQLASALDNPDLAVYTSRLPRISLVMFNLKDQSASFLQDASIRKALLMGIDRQEMINQIFGGQAIQANGVILPGTWAFNESTPEIVYDPTQAAELLKKAGYVVTGDTNPVRKKENTELTFALSYPDDEQHKKVAEFIAADWKTLDINVRLDPVPTDTFISDVLDPRAFQAALVDLNLSQTPDPDPYPFWDLSQAASGQNYSQWNNRLASDSLEQARVTTDLQERKRLYHNFQAIFAEDLPALPLYYPVYNCAIDTQIQGVSIGPLFDISDRLDSITSWYVTTRSTSKETEPAAGN